MQGAFPAAGCQQKRNARESCNGTLISILIIMIETGHPNDIVLVQDGPFFLRLVHWSFKL